MTSMLERVQSLVESAIPMSHIIVFDPQTGYFNQKHGTKLSVSEEEAEIPKCIFSLLYSNLRVDVHDDVERSQRSVKVSKEETISHMMYELARRLDSYIDKYQKRIKKDRIYFRDLLGNRVEASNTEKVIDILLNVYALYHKDIGNDGKVTMEMCKAIHEKYASRR